MRADLVHRDGRLLRFDVVAEQESAGAVVVVARGQVLASSSTGPVSWLSL